MKKITALILEDSDFVQGVLKVNVKMELCKVWT